VCRGCGGPLLIAYITDDRFGALRLLDLPWMGGVKHKALACRWLNGPRGCVQCRDAEPGCEMQMGGRDEEVPRPDRYRTALTPVGGDAERHRSTFPRGQSANLLGLSPDLRRKFAARFFPETKYAPHTSINETSDRNTRPAPKSARLAPDRRRS
jgi:hypothetical protein